MIELDGINYSLQSPMESVEDMRTFINTYCSDNNIRNSEGEIIHFDNNPSSLMFLILLGCAYRDSVFQELLYAVSTNFNIAEASDTQLLNLAKICRIVPKKASPTTVMVAVQAGEEGNAMVRTTDTCTIENIYTYKFRPAYEFTVPAGEEMSVVFVSDLTGVSDIPEGAITAFDAPIENVLAVRSGKFVAGKNAETNPELRWRMINTGVSGSEVDNAIAAIEELPGITSCNIFVNYDNKDIMYINGITIPPRKAAVFINGYSDGIADAYWRYMTSNTVDDSYAGTKAMLTIQVQNTSTSTVVIPKDGYVWSNGGAVYDLSDLGGRYFMQNAIIRIPVFALTYGIDESLPAVNTPVMPNPSIAGLTILVVETKQGLPPMPATDRTQVQYKETKSGQLIPCYFLGAQIQDIYVRVLVDSEVVTAINTVVENALLELNGSVGIGVNIFATDIIQRIQSKQPDFIMIGAYLSLDGETWKMKTDIPEGAVLRIKRANISVEDGR